MRSATICTFGLLLAGVPFTGALAAPPEQIEVDGVLSQEAVLAPIRSVFVFLGYELHWDDTSHQARLENSRGVLTVTIGKREASYTDKATREIRTGLLDEAPRHVGSVGQGLVSSMFRLAGLPYEVISHGAERTVFALGPKRIVVNHGAGSAQPAEDEEVAGLKSEPSEEATPRMSMINKTGKWITVNLWRGDERSTWKLPPHNTVGSKTMQPGKYSYKGAAPGVLGSSGTTTIQAYRRYTWTWYIVTR